jgi:hypothetical protein
MKFRTGRHHDHNVYWQLGAEPANEDRIVAVAFSDEAGRAICHALNHALDQQLVTGGPRPDIALPGGVG